MGTDKRILVLGDSEAGKSSLITAFLKNGPCPSEPSASTSKAAGSCLPVVSVPALNKGTLYIVDSPPVSNQQESNQESNLTLPNWHESELARADAVVLACSLDSGNGLLPSAKKWMQAIRDHIETKNGKKPRHHLPFILAATKSDVLVDVAAAKALLQKAKTAILKTFPEIEAICICSSLTNSGVAEVALQDYLCTAQLKRYHSFWNAQKAVDNPVFPLYDFGLRELRPQARQALAYVGNILRRNATHLLPADLQELQKRVFGKDIVNSDMDAILEQTRSASGSSSAEQNNIRQDEFEAVMVAFIARGRAESVWRILRYYGFSTDLVLKHSHLHPKLAYRTDGSEIVELSSAGIEFLVELQQAFEEDTSSSSKLLQHMEALGLGSDTAKPTSKASSQEAWIGRWQSIAAIDPPRLLEALAKLGYSQTGPIEDPCRKDGPGNRSTLGAVKVVKRDRGLRKVFICLVLGESASRDALHTATGDVVSLDEGRYAVLLQVTDLAQLSAKRLGFADSAIYAYLEESTTTSVQALVTIRETAPQKLLDLPAIVFGISKKDEKSEGVASPAAEARDFCAAARLSAPVVTTSGQASEFLRNELLRRGVGQRQYRVATATGLSSWLVWSSAMAAVSAVSFLALQRTGWLGVVQKYWQDRQ